MAENLGDRHDINALRKKLCRAVMSAEMEIEIDAAPFPDLFYRPPEKIRLMAIRDIEDEFSRPRLAHDDCPGCFIKRH